MTPSASLELFALAFPGFDKTTVYIPLAAAQSLLALDGKISEIVIRVDRQENMARVDTALKAMLNSHRYEVLTWKELAPDLVGMTKLFQEMLYLFSGVIYIAMIFGVMNTMLMALAERTRELGVLLALGTRPWRLLRQILCESALLGLLSVGGGGALSLSLVWWFSHRGIDLGWFGQGLSVIGLNRIIYPVLTPSNLVVSGLFAFVAVLLAAIWPAWRAIHLEPVEAIRSV